MNKRKKKKRQYNPKGNKKYKDRIFRLSFSKKKDKFDVVAKEAVDECIEKGILKDILIGHRAEVISMILSVDEKFYKKVLEKEAKEEGEERINLLNQKLLEDKRINDLERSVKDRKFQKQLMKEYGINDVTEETGFWGE